TRFRTWRRCRYRSRPPARRARRRSLHPGSGRRALRETPAPREPRPAAERVLWPARGDFEYPWMSSSMSPLIPLLGALPFLSAPALDLTIVDTVTGRPLPSRVLIEDSAHKHYAPAGSVPVPIGPERWFASDGKVHVEPAGPVKVRVERGPEYKTFRATL